MLSEAQYKEALQDGDKASGGCRPWCRYGVTIEDGVPKFFHNGLGPSSTSEQVITNVVALALSPSQWTGRFQAWLEALHKHQPYDLNTGA